MNKSFLFTENHISLGNSKTVESGMSDYYPFGMIMPGRSFSSENYRFGYQGQEIDLEVKGSGNSLDFGERIYDPRTAKFLSVDPLTRSFPWYTPYQYAGNNPIANIDLDGRESLWFMDWFLGNLVKAKQENPDAEAVELAANTAGNMLTDVLGNSDLNDATVIGTAINRGPNKAINFDGSQADNADLTFATVGALVPFISGSAIKNVVKKAANVINKNFIELGWKAPYKMGTNVYEFTLKESENFVRLSRENVDGDFLVKADEIKGLSPSDIKDKLSLKYEPTHISDVKVGAGSKLRVGEAAPVKEWGTNGGATQFEILERKNVEFTNTRPLSQ